jgi:hypothetical protein
MAGKNVQMALKKMTAHMKAALMINLILAMAHASMTSGNVMAGMTVQMALMKLTVLQAVQTAILTV